MIVLKFNQIVYGRDHVMSNGGNSLGPEAAIYKECTLLCHVFTNIVFMYCPKKANMAGHILATNSDGPMLIVWQKEPLVILFGKFTQMANVSV